MQKCKYENDDKLQITYSYFPTFLQLTTNLMEAKKPTYKEAVSEIEEILEKLENDELDIDELAVKVKRVSVLLRYCKEKLTTTDKEIQSIIDDLEKPE